MKLITFLWAFLSSGIALGAGPSPCYWAGTTTKCFPTTGLYLNNSRSLRLGTNDETNYVELKAPNGITSYTLTFPVDDGTSGQVLSTDGSGVLSWLTPLVNPMDSAGDMIYGGTAGVATKLDNGTAGQLLMANGAAAPTWASTISGTKTWTGEQIVQAGVSGGFAATVENTVGAASTDNGLLVKVAGSGAAHAFEVAMGSTDLFSITGAGVIATKLRQSASTSSDFGSILENLAGTNNTDNGLQVKVGGTGATKVLALTAAGSDVLTVNGAGKQTFTGANSGIAGFTDGSSAAAGIVGETAIQSRVRSSSLSVSSGAVTNVLSSALSLTAGDWEISGFFVIETSAASTVTAGTIQYGISRTSASFSANDTIGVPTSGEVQMRDGRALAASAITVFPIAPFSYTVNATTSFYLVEQVTITGTVSVYGSIHARRLR